MTLIIEQLKKDIIEIATSVENSQQALRDELNDSIKLDDLIKSNADLQTKITTEHPQHVRGFDAYFGGIYTTTTQHLSIETQDGPPFQQALMSSVYQVRP